MHAFLIFMSGLCMGVIVAVRHQKATELARGVVGSPVPIIHGYEELLQHDERTRAPLLREIRRMACEVYLSKARLGLMKSALTEIATLEGVAAAKASATLGHVEQLDLEDG